jgi:hypothetical protein
MPETALFITRPVGAKAKVTVRRYRENVQVALALWGERHPEAKAAKPADAQRAALAAVSRKFDTFEADLDAHTFDAVARVWSRMLDRARPDARRRKVIVHDHVGYTFQDGKRSAIASGRAEDSAAARLVGLANALVTYASEGPVARRRLANQLAPAALSLEADLDALKECPASD